jgi:hypothetical protein
MQKRWAASCCQCSQARHISCVSDPESLWWCVALQCRWLRWRRGPPRGAARITPHKLDLFVPLLMELWVGWLGVRLAVWCVASRRVTNCAALCLLMAREDVGRRAALAFAERERERTERAMRQQGNGKLQGQLHPHTARAGRLPPMFDPHVMSM